jgi:hypothetical protein
MNQATRESPEQRPFPEAPPRGLVDEAYALVPRRGDFMSRPVQQEVTITYLSARLGNGQPISFYAPPSACCPRGFRLNGTLGECTDLPWIVDRFYMSGLDRDYRVNRDIRRILDNINMRT